ncbi:cobaltochelatase CobT-related protein [Marinobacterium arenosum]|uniref:cobaltochelatase CobT-related protein n=1 Tax=Marinobacterium arenosum TaxID=2862496 RepID=UPI001C96F870|nr:cobalamin biosynthesis protein CobT [Marinobacterium arenosum]MBY4677457.1 cobalamin biosynthesis protein CobT [Marinobacterium arenosum]
MSQAEERAPRTEKLQQQAEELCAATLRALTGLPGLRFRGRQLELNGKRCPIHAPHLHTDAAVDDFRSFRGAADGMALRLLYSDPVLHQQKMPQAPVSRLVFELLEQLRCEALATAQLPGMKQNLLHRFQRWCEQFNSSSMTENHVGLLVYTLAQVCWSRLSGRPVDERTEGLIEPHRMMLAPHIGHDLAGLRRQAAFQAKYADHALGIVAVLESLVEQLDRESDEQAAKARKEELISSFNLHLNIDEGDSELAALGASGSTQAWKTLTEQLASYRVFSRAFDRELPAAKAVRPALLPQLRERLDRRIAGQGVNLNRLTRLLRRLLAAPQRDGWQFGMEEGYLDGRRLPALVTNPDNRQLFKQERNQPQSDCLVTFLIDNSGSMKGHIESIAMLVDLFSRALEQAGANTEILGFTTGAWQGGKVVKQWQRQGKPANPGRLNELCHIVYKDADTRWRRARPSIAAMLKPDLFREGIDGEALLWAASRMNGRPEQRKILIVLSDGCPMDTATSLNNEADYLDNHLKQVAAMLESRGEIELYALGVGLDLSAYYRRSLALDIEESLDNGVFMEILQLLGRR